MLSNILSKNAQAASKTVGYVNQICQNSFNFPQLVSERVIADPINSAKSTYKLYCEHLGALGDITKVYLERLGGVYVQ